MFILVDVCITQWHRKNKAGAIWATSANTNSLLKRICYFPLETCHVRLINLSAFLITKCKHGGHQGKNYIFDVYHLLNVFTSIF